MNLLKLKYKLTGEEIHEALLCLDWKREGNIRDVNLWILSILGAIVLVMYMRNPERFYLAVLLIFIIMLLFYLAYGPAVRRKGKIKKMIRENGEYMVEITDSGIAYGSDGRKLQWNGKRIKFMNSEHMILIKMEREVFAIPRRILNEEQQEELVKLSVRHKCDRMSIVMKEKGE